MSIQYIELTRQELYVLRRLAGTRMALCASPAYLRKHGTPRHPHELAEHVTLAYSYWSSGDEWRFEGPESAVSVRVKPWMHTNNGDSCRAAALAGCGIILQPFFLVGEDLQRIPRRRSRRLRGASDAAVPFAARAGDGGLSRRTLQRGAVAELRTH